MGRARAGRRGRRRGNRAPRPLCAPARVQARPLLCGRGRVCAARAGEPRGRPLRGGRDPHSRLCVSARQDTPRARPHAPATARAQRCQQHHQLSGCDYDAPSLQSRALPAEHPRVVSPAMLLSARKLGHKRPRPVLAAAERARDAVQWPPAHPQLGGGACTPYQHGRDDGAAAWAERGHTPQRATARRQHAAPDQGLGRNAAWPDGAVARDAAHGHGLVYGLPDPGVRVVGPRPHDAVQRGIRPGNSHPGRADRRTTRITHRDTG